ncbi:MAG TPA: hypothetical protein VFZ73_19870, partial [Gemmatimonadaceae bacterium]
DLKVTPLRDSVSPRSRDVIDSGRGHGLTLPGRRDRQDVRDQGRIYHLRGSEVELLARAAQFRVTFTEDLKQDAGDGNRFQDDLRSLKEQGLIAERTVTRLREGAVADVVSATPAGKALLDHHRNPAHNPGQVYYSGWVKPGEVWHDASLFRMVRQVEAELQPQGSRIQRVILDDELKGAAYRAFHEARSAGEPDRYARLAVAQAQGLHVDGDRFVFPDVRLEVQDRDGSVRTVDLELVTKDYHRGHLSGKARAGFRMFGSGSGGSRGGTPQDSHHVGRLVR